ncbi:MAG: MmcQ/YjbR family DNA-binding protein [Actinomycetota bacterium]
MAQAPEQFQYALSEQIRSHALTFPETEEGTSCVNRAFKAGGKNFVFLGEKDQETNIRLKLDASIPEIQERAAEQDRTWDVGKGGWAMLRFDPEDPPPAADLERWITESFLLLAPKKVSKLLDTD